MWQAFNYTKHNGIALRKDYARDYSASKKDCEYDTSKFHFKPSNLGMIE